MRSVQTAAEPERTPGRSPSEHNFTVTRWAAAALASMLIMCVDSSVQAQEPQTAIDDTRRFAEYLIEANSHITEAARKGNIRAERVLAVIMNQPIEFREAPPYGLLNLLIGQVVASLEPGTVVDIREEKIVPTFRGGEVWYSVQVLYSPEDGENTQYVEGWINAGVSGVDGVMIANQEAAR